MTRPKMPPTPASSTEIKGQDHSNQLSSLQLTFELPPSAMSSPAAPKNSGPGTRKSPISPTSLESLPFTTYLQPSETVKARRRSSAAQQKESSFALPPPPTRSRKIIQMKPGPQEEPAAVPSPAKGSAGTGSQSKHASGSGVAAGSKSSSTKKQPSATSAAGRKIARKTAHSLIERRRRSKMNEEFAVLKGLIPACTGEMHKLAILQVSQPQRVLLFRSPYAVVKIILSTATELHMLSPNYHRPQSNTSGILKTASRSSKHSTVRTQEPRHPPNSGPPSAATRTATGPPSPPQT